MVIALVQLQMPRAQSGYARTITARHSLLAVARDSLPNWYHIGQRGVTMEGPSYRRKCRCGSLASIGS